MEIKIIGSTNGIKTKDDALRHAQSHGRVCYSAKSFEKLEQEEGRKIGEQLLNTGHHSPFDHIMFCLELSGIPKMGAMILNSERMCTTSEKSARYTQMKLEGEQEALYDKWKGRFEGLIRERYPQLDDVKIGKLAQENARYLTSVFTPTHMTHTVSFRQLNYLVHWFDRFQPGSEFTSEIKRFMDEFSSQIKDLGLYEERLDPAIKRRGLTLFADRDRFTEEWGENYSTTYSGSLAQLAQAHRHRTLGYSIVGVDEPLDHIFIPPILIDSGLEFEWKADTAQEKFPQGALVEIHEWGNYKDFISKANERLCGQAQWETMNQTSATLQRYLQNTRNADVYGELVPYSHGPKCTFPDAKCREPCKFGKELGLERLI